MSAPLLLDAAFFARDALFCARELIGVDLVHGDTRGQILETEAYRETGDPACHLFTRPSARAFAKTHPAGTAYVYLNYGVHWLVNVLCLEEKTGEAGFVLIRALDPVAGLAEMEERRGTRDRLRLCSGPGKLGAALAIDGSFHGRSLVEDVSFCFQKNRSAPALEIIADRRIGISAGQDLKWRFLARDHPGVSVKAGRGR